jgi:hypothetical protein
MANETIASGGTLTLSTPLSGTNIQFLNAPSVGGELIVEPAAFVITSVTTGGSIVIGSVSLGGSIINDAPGDLVALQTLDSVYAALDVAFNAASENAQFNYEMKFSAESGVLYFVENDGTVKPSVNSPLTNLDANTDKILDELAGGLFGTGAAGATVTIAPFLVGTGVNTAVTDAMITVGTAIIPCFAAGTRILTVRGEIPVENLAAGDRVITIAGEEQEVVWIGRRVVDVAAHPRPETVRPIVLAPDALAEGVPARRLALSPDHALFLDGALVQAKDLVNDVTIRADPAARWVTYFHVELARHDAIFAEGAPAESFLDTGHRAAFETGAPPPRAETMQRRRERASFAPLVTGGEALARVRERLARRLRPDLCSGALRSRM